MPPKPRGNKGSKVNVNHVNTGDKNIKGVRVLVVGHRKAQCMVLKSGYKGFYCQREMDVARAKRENSVIIHFENLHWLTDLGPVDTLLLDDFRTLLNDCATHRDNCAVLVRMMASAGMVMPMDADMEIDQVVPQLTASIFKPETMEIHRYMSP